MQFILCRKCENVLQDMFCCIKSLMSRIRTTWTLLALFRNFDIYKHIPPNLNMLHAHFDLLLFLQGIVLRQYSPKYLLRLQGRRVRARAATLCPRCSASFTFTLNYALNLRKHREQQCRICTNQKSIRYHSSYNQCIHIGIELLNYIGHKEQRYSKRDFEM